ncbi:MAG: histidine--tRNA ligase [Actinobacteria bacterium]|nr:histidine--tRNA ligase [Actinomycetota bacterium]
MIRAPRGTHDVLPSEQPLWGRVLTEAEALCALYGYRRIVTPGFEETELFQRTSGAGSDIVQKEMYTFSDRADRSLTLRPEATAPIARAYVEHGLRREPQPQKLYTVAPLYRYATPQRGRYREHWQVSVEALGSPDPALDAELIQLYSELLRRLGVVEYELQLNSIGDAACRPAYIEELSAWLDEHDAELDDEARSKRSTSPLRVFDVKSPRVREALAEAPKIGESLCGPCEEHFAAVCRTLDALDVTYRVEPTLVRGLDYYTRTTWQFEGPDEGQQSTLSGGGRYDGLVEEVGGPATPGVGFGAGIERLLLAMADAGTTAEAPTLDVFFVLDEGAPREPVLVAMAELRRHGLSCDTDYASRSLRGQLTQAGRLGAARTVIAGAETAVVRERGEADVTVPLAGLVATLAR